ncbi:alpha/beta hydrolase [Caldimonas brevitalea]|uniref:Alpha/beta hydrolase n=1 Tax=Caldimonas brevitalea TaxID=413882 RepID=A0A0G3BPS9_9BURK|nr:alpha/beta fold hydrolase [Caldimonas brevitalea]AKJ29993.1 alpha/beta hydrolase [Caldimonas brevitalea]
MNFTVALRWRLAPVLLSFIVLMAGCSALDTQQRRWIFQPMNSAVRAGVDGIEGMQDVWIGFHSQATGEQVRLHALWLEHSRRDAPVLLYLHGARWGVAGNATAARMRRMQAMGFSVLAVDYRGFGRSTASLPSQQKAHEDARAAWDWIATRQPGSRRYIFGHSLGGAIAVGLAAEVDQQLDGLMVEGTFTSVPDVFATLRWGWLPLGWLITQRFDSAARIGEVQAPVLVVHGSDDNLIKPELGRALYERVRAPKKRFVLVEGGTHHSTHADGQAQYREAVRELFGLPG